MALTRYLRQVVLASALAGLALAGCTSDSSDAANAVDITTTTTTVPSTTTTAVPERGRFVLAGDSMMFDVAPGVIAAIDPTVAEVLHLVVPSLFSPTVGTSLIATVEAAPTDVVVILAGIWETGYETTAGLTVVDPGWGEGYRAEVLLPFVDHIEELGAHLLLLGHPPMREGDPEARLANVYAEWERVADERPEQVTYLPTGPWLGAGDGYVEVVDGRDGEPTRLRRTDGVHFCAEGATRMAGSMVDALAAAMGDAWQPAVVAGWEEGPWLERFPLDECPPVEAGP